MDQARIDELIERYLLKTATVAEQQELLDWYNSQNELDVIWTAELPEEEMLVRARLLANINAATAPKTKKLFTYSRIAVAAAAVAALMFGIWFFNDRTVNDSKDQRAAVNTRDIAPGKNGATITMANGKVIQLSANKTGVVVGSGLKYTDGSTDPALSEAAALPSGAKSMMLTASTSKGQTYQFTLPDGTKVWLNADSKIEFPSQFSEGKRKIMLSGEGYFEVAKDKAHPFVVQSRGQELEVLGTHFNVNAYTDEAAVKTTLLEGKVRVHSLLGKPNDQQGRTVMEKTLVPGQQSRFENYGFALSEVNTENEIDWKNGDFIFQQESLESIMRKVSRWYDVDVIYADNVDRSQTFSGKVSRSRNISQVIRALQITQALKFRITGKTIYIN